MLLVPIAMIAVAIKAIFAKEYWILVLLFISPALTLELITLSWKHLYFISDRQTT